MTTTIPSYGLYGEEPDMAIEFGAFFNLEYLPERSGIYNWKIPAHVHKFLIQILYIKEGTCKVFLNNIKKQIDAPTLLVIPAGTVHSLNYSHDVDGPSITATQRSAELVAQALMPEIVQIIRKPQAYPISNDNEAQEILRIYENIHQELKTTPFGHFPICASLLFTIFIKIAALSSQQENIKTIVPSRKALLVDKFLALINSKDKVHATVQEYADSIGITSGHLSRSCREVLGISANDVVNNFVIQDAQKELVYTKLSIKQIADSLGFSDEAYFTRFFKKHIGMSPKKFRETVMKDFWN